MGQTNIIKDGQPVILPFEEATGRQLKQQLAVPAERHLIVTEGGESRAIGDHETVHLREGDTLSEIPRWRAGSIQPRAKVGHRLTAETNCLSAAYQQEATFGFDLSLEKWWVQLQRFYMPIGWNFETTPILIVVNNHYPASQPDGFYLSKKLTDSRGRTPAHYFERQHLHNSLTARGWAWFCIHPEWKPTVDVREGDNLLKYMSLIHLVLSDASKGEL